MHRTSAMNLKRQVLGHHRPSRPQTANPVVIRPCDVFINHRVIDTRRTVASLLYDHLTQRNLRPFLGDHKNMKPGENQFEQINGAIRGCKIGVAVFSPRYCESYICLHELALMMECKKKVIPIFCDVKPSELRVVAENGSRRESEVQRLRWALEEAKYTVGLTFDSSKGNWSDLVTSALDIVIESLREMEDEQQMHRPNSPTPFRYTSVSGRVYKK